MFVPKKRCVNLDWVELYCLEDRDQFPCNADYFRRHGYFVDEREYGTRQYAEMFTIETQDGHPWIEVRRNPKSGSSDFKGFVPESCHLRLHNSACYAVDCIEQLRQFMLKHQYTFVRIFRIDVCYDFEVFDSGDKPQDFFRRYLNRTYTKINQCKLSVHGEDRWEDFNWQTLSWGNPKSMVTTKFYHKSQELSTPKHDKPYIRYSWFVNELISDPVTGNKKLEDGSVYKPEIWRIEFSVRSTANRLVRIEDSDSPKEEHAWIPHTLQCYDTPDRLWHRFADLAHHYFRFVIKDGDKRKDRCEEKVLFVFGKDFEFMRLEALPPASKPDRDDLILLKRLKNYKMVHPMPDVVKACDLLISKIEDGELRRVSVKMQAIEVMALRLTISAKMKGDTRDALVILNEFKSALENKEMF